MKTEIEVKFLQVSHDELRAKLRELDAKCMQPMRLMRRVTIDSEFMRTGKDSFLRVRDEGDKVTMTYKQFDDLSLHGAKEIEVTVSSFEDTVELLRQAGLPARSFQESKRETWQLGDAEIVLDEWPWLKPYVEIEGPTEAIVRKVAENLGLEWENDAVFGDVMVAYRADYPHLGLKDTLANLAESRFGAPLPDMLKP